MRRFSSLRGDGPYPASYRLPRGACTLNTLVSEPSNAPGFASRFFVNDLNGVLYILDKNTKKFIPYVVFPEIFPRMDTETLASGIGDHCIRSQLREQWQVLYGAHGEP